MCQALVEDRPSPAASRPKQCPGNACAARSCDRLQTRKEPVAGEQARTVKVPIPISSDFVGEILSPYKPHARYLQSAEIKSYRDRTDGKGALVTATGQFGIKESCYIDDTGHFNAVEFNICFNQLAYVMFGKCIEAGIMHRLRQEKVDVISLPEYKRRQLPAMVIVSIESRYYKQLDSRSFQGQLTVDKISSVGSAWFFFTSISFSDAQGVKAKGSVVLPYSPDFTPAR